jgi:hypothetical protein
MTKLKSSFMKMNQLLATIGIGLLFVAQSGCDKSITPEKPKPDATALQALTSTNIETQTQRFVMDASTGGKIKGSKGTILQFSPNGFLNASNEVVTGIPDQRCYSHKKQQSAKGVMASKKCLSLGENFM